MAEETLRTLERALEVLRSFGRDCPEQTVAQVAGRVAMPRSVVVRILATLEQAGFVARTPGNSRRFRIGLGACEVGALYFAGNPLLRCAEDVLHDLAERTGFTAYLGILHGAEIVILALREGRTPVRFIWHPGDRLPVATTALGKALLMHLPPAQLDTILGKGPLAGLTDGSIGTRAELDAQLARHVSLGWITATDESYPGVFAVGAAVRTPDGAPVAGISLSLLTHSVGPDEVAASGEAVLDAAATIGRRIAPGIAYGRDSFGPFRSAARNAQGSFAMADGHSHGEPL